MKYKKISLALLSTVIGFNTQAKNVDYYSICLDLSGNINNEIVDKCSFYAINKYESEMTMILNKVKKSNVQKYNALKNQQKKWLKDMDGSCESGQIRPSYCMLGEYDDRLTELKKQFKN
jgi:uncharacterized protein YecT (DUF1311 family)